MSDAENKSQSSPEAQAADAEASQSIIDAMLTKLETTDVEQEQKDFAKSFIQVLSMKFPGAQVNKVFFSEVLDHLDAVISSQLDEILHHEKFKQLESAWTSLKWMTDRTDFNENIRIEILSVSKDELLRDFEDAGETTVSGLYRRIYSAQYGAPNGKPYGAMVLNYEFSHRAPDVELLRRVAEVSAMSHAPVLSAVSPDIFGPRGYEQLTDPRFSLKDHFAGREFVKWNGMREDENAKYIGLTMPHFLLRLPYNEKDNPTDAKEFRYVERIEGKKTNYLWGNAAFALATRLTESYKKYRWCWRIVGEESGGAVADLKMHVFHEHGEVVQKPPTSVALDFRHEQLLNESGLIPLMWLREKDQAVFYGTPSFKLPLTYPDTEEGRKAQSNEALRSRLQYMFILTRFAHYLKRLQTKYIGAQIDKDSIHKELGEWIRQYVNQVKNPGPLMGKYPLFSASVTVEEDQRNPGMYICEFKMVPNTLVEGFSTTLSLVSRQDLAKK
jgi:type VI secretion system protein ImpC